MSFEPRPATPEDFNGPGRAPSQIGRFVRSLEVGVPARVPEAYQASSAGSKITQAFANAKIKGAITTIDGVRWAMRRE